MDIYGRLLFCPIEITAEGRTLRLWGRSTPICGISGTLDWNGGLAIYPNRIQKSMDVNQSRDYIRRPRKMPSRH